jgi:predicted O-linked N-acetylglucosamine transferase (SPINDLY family)
VLLPGCRFVYAPVVQPTRAPPPVLRNGFVTFGSFNRNAKITRGTLLAWSAILARVPQSRLQLRSSVYGGAGSVQWLRERWRDVGVPVERIDFRPYVPLEQAMQAYTEIDIALDTTPYNGGVTTCDALVSGVPVITSCGERMIARQSAALLHAAGHDEWVASSLADYVERAVAAADGALLARIRPALLEEVPRSRLCDVPRFVSTFEGALAQLAELGPRAQPGLAPLVIAR